jgi:hypothetical protein
MFLKTFNRFICLAVFFVFTKAGAQGNLLVTPKRVVFEGSKKSEELNLANVGKDSATFVISFIQIRMNEDGTFEKITGPDSAQRFADKYIRFFPRTVTLAPNEAQTVKMQLTRIGELLPGEYRSHLYFRAVPVKAPLGEKEVAVPDSSISVKLVPVFGISMPVIVRVGPSDSRVHLAEASFMETDSQPSLNITFERSGNMSVYGDVFVDYVSNEGKTTRVGIVKGLAVYTPNARRRFQLILDKNPDVNYHSGRLHVTYSDQSPKPLQLAEREIVLN